MTNRVEFDFCKLNTRSQVSLGSCGTGGKAEMAKIILACFLSSQDGVPVSFRTVLDSTLWKSVGTETDPV